MVIYRENDVGKMMPANKKIDSELDENFRAKKLRGHPGFKKG